MAAFSGDATPEQLTLIAKATRDSKSKKTKFTQPELEAAQLAIFQALPPEFQPPASLSSSASN